MIIDEIKRKALEAAKGGDAVARDVLRLALGEIQMAVERAGAEKATDEISAAAVRKLVKSNEETLGLSTDEAANTALRHELETLRSLLPKSLGVEEILAALAAQKDAIRAAANDGQATGIAMKQLKAAGAVVDGKDVTAAVKQLRA